MCLVSDTDTNTILAHMNHLNTSVFFSFIFTNVYVCVNNVSGVRVGPVMIHSLSKLYEVEK